MMSTPGTYVIAKNGKPYAQIQTVQVKPTDVPSRAQVLNPVWWMECGGSKSSFSAPLINNGAPYLPTVTDQMERDFLWWVRNPACNFVGFVVGFEGVTYKVTGTYPVLTTTKRDLGTTGITWSLIDGWAPFVSYSGEHWELYLGWRPASGGFGAKVVRHSAPITP